MPIRVTKAEECDARDDDSSNAVGVKKIGATMLNAPSSTYLLHPDFIYGRLLISMSY